jgi:hypothetical protein
MHYHRTVLMHYQHTALPHCTHTLSSLTVLTHCPRSLSQVCIPSHCTHTLSSYCTHYPRCVSRGDAELCQWFHRSGLPFNTVNKGGHSPLHKAAWHGQCGIVRWLVDGLHLGHTIIRRDEKGRSVIDLAEMNGHHSLAVWLQGRWERQVRRHVTQQRAIW